MSKKFYISTPIYYPNGTPHIGHAYNAIAADVFARFARLEGKETFFLSGTDEHGLKMQQTALEKGITPQELADLNSAVFQKMLQTLNCSNNCFIRTTEARHHRASQALWRRMEDNGDIYLDRYAGWYSIRQESYYDEKDTILGEDGIRREKEVGSPVSWNEEESYFFRLSNYQDRLLALYESEESFIAPAERRNEMISFVKRGLKDISISRTTFNWGIPVPQNDKHVMYVWVDALTNYITALGFPDEGSENWKFWPANLHLIGKDIIRFHTIFWPAFLMSAGLPLPKRVFAHGFLLNRGEKMSKSVGNVVDPFQLVEQYGSDQLRYFLMREVAFGQDGSYSHELIINRINADLANDLGNLVQRSLSLLVKYCDGKLPDCSISLIQDQSLWEEGLAVVEVIKQHMHSQEAHLALGVIFALIAKVNRYFANEAPWVLRKTDFARFQEVLYLTAEMLRIIGILLIPFMPLAANKLLDTLGVDQNNRLLYNIFECKLQAGQNLGTLMPLFPRYLAESSKEENNFDD